MFYQLPPVGNPVALTAGPVTETASVALPCFSDYQTRFYQSGTAALAAAIVVAKKQKNISDPEVILPAYACPDLVSAAVFAGVKPVLVDLEFERPWLDLAQLEATITGNTVAVVAVNLFGIAERLPRLQQLTNQKGILLIEDSAQFFPGNNDSHGWQGDLVVLSFGRGKPVSLLGGGAVLVKSTSLFELLPDFHPTAATTGQRFSFSVKAGLYNTMILPGLYWIPSSLPFLHLGETSYHELQVIESMDQVRLDLLASNIARYQRDDKASKRCEKVSAMLETLDKTRNLPRLCNMDMARRLLRYPLLLEKDSRDRVCMALLHAGLGASVMYPASLPKIAGLNHILDQQQRFSNAEDFASRLLTLPAYSNVSEKNIEKMKAILKQTV